MLQSKIGISRIIGIIFALIGLGFGWWAVKNYSEKVNREAASIEQNNKGLEEQEKNLLDLQAREDYYIQETENLTNKAEEILTHFPTYMYLEDKVLYADDMMNNVFQDYDLEQFSYGDSQFVLSTTFGGDSSPLELYSVTLGGRFNALDYKQWLDLLNYGLTAEQRFVLTSIKAGFNNANGLLSGDFSYKTYFIPGQSSPYEFPEYIITDLGEERRTDNIFGTFEKKEPALVPQEQTQDAGV